MAISSTQVMAYQCDGCGAHKYGKPGEFVTGYLGSISQTFPDGVMVTAQFWAHTLKCIGNAAKNALKREKDNPTKGPSLPPIIDVHLPPDSSYKLAIPGSF